jgi:hypothetical protein
MQIIWATYIPIHFFAFFKSLIILLDIAVYAKLTYVPVATEVLDFLEKK